MKMDQKTMKAMRNMDKNSPKRMKAGGPTSMDMKKFGRNMARVKNQRGG